MWSESHQGTEYTHWATNQPDNANGREQEDCVVKVIILYPVSKVHLRGQAGWTSAVMN